MIKLIVLAIDGTLTDGGVAYGSGLETENFSVKDGLMLKMLPSVGIPVLLLAGRESEAIRQRAVDLSGELIENTANKGAVLEKILDKRGLTFEDAAYIGNDLNDFEALKRCVFKACPSDAAAEVKALANYISPFPAGHGAVHDVCDRLLEEAGLHEACEKLLKASEMNEAFLRMFQSF